MTEPTTEPMPEPMMPRDAAEATNPPQSDAPHIEVTASGLRVAIHLETDEDGSKWLVAMLADGAEAHDEFDMGLRVGAFAPTTTWAEACARIRLDRMAGAYERQIMQLRESPDEYLAAMAEAALVTKGASVQVTVE